MCVCVLPRIEIESRYRSQFQSSFIRLYLYRSVSISFSFDAKQAALLPINNFLLVWIPNQMNLFRNIKKFLLIHSPACSLAHRFFHFRFSVVCEEFFFEKRTFAFLIRIYVLFVLPSLSNFNSIKMSLKKEEFEENPHLIMQNPISTAYTLSHVYIYSKWLSMSSARNSPQNHSITSIHINRLIIACIHNPHKYFIYTPYNFAAINSHSPVILPSSKFQML